MITLNNKELKEQLALEASRFVPNHSDQIKEKVKYVNFIPTKKQVTNPLKKKMAPVLALGMITIILTFILPLLLFPNDQVTPLSNTFITIDINPSIELEIDPNNLVSRVRPLNEDAVILLSGEESKILKKRVFEAIKEIIKIAMDEHYLDGNDLLISAVNENQEQELAILNKIKAEVKDYLEELNYQGNLSFLEGTSHLKKQAKKLGISVGKLQLINKALERNPNLTIDDLKDKSIQEINNIIRNYNQDVVNFEANFQALFLELTNKVLADFNEKVAEYENTHGNINRLNIVLNQLEKAQGKINQNQYHQLLSRLKDIYKSLQEQYPDDLVPLMADMNVDQIVSILNDFQSLTISRLDLVNQNKNQRRNELIKALREKVKENIDNGLTNPLDIDIDDFLKNYLSKR